jgi:flagellar biosynthesis/type III secretory pathway chaperone
MWGPRAAAAVTCGGKKRKLEEHEDKNQELKEENQELKEETQELKRRCAAQVQENERQRWFLQGKFEGIQKLQEINRSCVAHVQDIERQSRIWQVYHVMKK